MCFRTDTPEPWHSGSCCLLQVVTLEYTAPLPPSANRKCIQLDTEQGARTGDLGGVTVQGKLSSLQPAFLKRLRGTRQCGR